MTAAADFQQAIRHGRRCGTTTLVAHYWCCSPEEQPARIGFAVSRAVGNSVMRHRVVRRLRHASRTHLEQLPNGSLLVVRATPAAAGADTDQLASDLGRAVQRLRGRR